ncbi:MATE family efflux transporter [Sphingomonas sp. Leaf339]|uniref:MATE family efflux transporter n=1 Tax=Sphingomonas sp. Leaf339 TaxID=1736343 RepID=UPI0006F39D5D|nr:MATE family efflux transporter [Sphingomonas sp. Leaf339]KQU48214.1 MATE family efflux transporter [Sphingomonas sp. Leaf339]
MHPPAPHSVTAAAPASERAELRATLALATPLVAANLLQMGVYSIDVIFVARLGTTELAAATLGVYLYSVLAFAMIGLVGAAAPLIAAELGRRAHAVRQVRRSFRMAMWLAAVAGLGTMAILANGERLLLLTHQDAHVAARAGAFLDILLWATIPAVATGVMRVTASALGRPGWAMLVTGLGLCMGLLGNWLLVFGRAGFPALGLEGSAIASVVTSVAMMLAFVLILLLDRKLCRYRLFGHWWRTEWSRLREIFRLGAPIALTMTFEGALFSAAGFLMGLIGVTEVAAHAIALQIAAIAFQVPFGIAQAATIRVGMAYGARDHVWIGRAGRVSLTVGIGFMVFTASLLLIAPRLFVGVYVDPDAPANAALVALALQYLGVAAAFQLFDGAQAVAAGVLRGLQDTRVPMLAALFGYWVIGAGCAVLLGFCAGWQGLGIWWGLAAGLAAVAALLLWRWTARARLGLLPPTLHPN